MRKPLIALGTGAVGLWLFAAPAAAASDDAVIVGDSILNLTKDELAPRIENWQSVVDAINGSGLTEQTTLNTGKDWLTTLALYEQDRDPDTVVVVLGTNDAQSVAMGVDYGPYVDRVLAVTDARRLLWATCSTRTASAVINAGCTTINAELRSRSRIEVVPYDPDITGRSDFGGPDSVHPGPEGQLAFAEMLDQWIGDPK